MNDRQPPQNLEAERGVIGSILMDGSVLVDVMTVVTAGDFYRESHQLIYQAAADLFEAGSQVDATLLAEELGRRGHLARAGGEDYLGECYGSVPHSANARLYAQIVRQKAMVRKLVEECTEIIRGAYANTQTAEELIADAERRVMAVGESAAVGESVTLYESSRRSMDRARQRRDGKLKGLESGLGNLDFIIGGFHPRKLYVLAARPSIGKSALAMNIAERIATEQQVPTLFVSLEMDHMELSDRFLCNAAGVDGDSLRYPTRMADDQWRDLDYVVESRAKASKLVIDDPAHMTVSQFTANARRHKARHGLGFLVVDYLQMLDGQPRKGELREQEVARVSRRLKAIAKELHVPVLALAQLNRAVESREDRRPRISDLRESGSIEADADVVMLLHRPDYYDPDDDPGMAYVLIPKHRDGPVGTVELCFDKEQQRFRDFNPEIPR